MLKINKPEKKRLFWATPDLLDALQAFPVKTKNQTFEQFYNCAMSWYRTDRAEAITKAEKTQT